MPESELCSPPTFESDLEFARRLMQGDPEAWGDLPDENDVTRGSGMLDIIYRAVRPLANNPEIALDLAMECVQVMIVKLATYRGEGPLTAWVQTLCRREVARRADWSRQKLYNQVERFLRTLPTRSRVIREEVALLLAEQSTSHGAHILEYLCQGLKTSEISSILSVPSQQITKLKRAAIADLVSSPDFVSILHRHSHKSRAAYNILQERNRLQEVSLQDLVYSTSGYDHPGNQLQDAVTDKTEDSQGLTPEEVIDIKQAIAGLRSEYRHVLQLKAQGYSDQEIAAEMEIPTNTAKTWLRRARLALRRSLKNNSETNVR
jgi:DNA-directed RNA polymerase specialized sigma24 family protein